MEDYHCWKADLTGALLIGNVYNICYKQNEALLNTAAPTSTSRLVAEERVTYFKRRQQSTGTTSS